MDCPACGTENTRVLETFKGAADRRKRQCACGARFTSTETPDKGSIRVPLVPISGDRPPGIPPGGTPSPSVATDSRGGVGGALPSGSDPDPDPGPVVSDPPIRAREPAAPPRIATPSDRPTAGDPKRPTTAHGLLQLFGRRWTAHYNKPWYAGTLDSRIARDLVEAILEIPDDAARAQAFAELPVAVETYLRIQKPYYAGHSFATFAKDLAALRTNGNAPERPHHEPRCDFHVKPGTTNKPRPGGKARPGCPECKHVELRRFERGEAGADPAEVKQLLEASRFKQPDTPGDGSAP